MNFRDVEHLSAYLDGRLEAPDKSRLEARLVADAGLRRVLDDLRVARGLLRRIPRRRAPRNFTLSPLNSRVRAPQPRAVPVLRYAGAVASLLFVFAVAINAVSPLAARSMAAAPGYGMGGGGAPDSEAPQESLAIAPSGTPGAEALTGPRDALAPTAEAQAKAAPPAEAPASDLQRGSHPPVAAVWVLLLAAFGLILIGLSWYLDQRTRRNFRSKILEK